MKFIIPLLCSSVFAHAAVYSIDINDADNSVTAVGWTALDTNHTGNGGLVTLDGIDFSVGSADGSRLRGTIGSPSPDALLGDFSFDDGSGQALIMFFGGAGDLAAGDWQVEVWVWDNNYGVGMGDQSVGYRTNGTETEMSATVAPSSSGAAYTFNFTSNGTSTYDLYLRENNAGNRSRLNAVRLTLVPEPSSTALLGLGGLALLIRRKR